MRGFRGLASLGPFLGAPAGSPGQVKYTGGTGSGAWHPLTPSWAPFAYCSGTDRGMPVPQIMLVRGGGTACAVYIPQVQFLDKVVFARCCSVTGACGWTAENCGGPAVAML